MSPYRSNRVAVAVVIAIAVWLGGCKQGPRRAPAIGEAYVGPATMKLRSDIPLDASAVATVKHGERLEIIQRKRRFFKVRAASGAEGWTDDRELLNAADIAYLKELTKKAAKLPVQGQAVSYGALNVHTQPARQSPSFLQIKDKEKFDVLARVVAARTELPRKPLIPPAPKKKKSEAKKTAAKPPKYPPPPMPKPPAPPKNWLELSKTELPDDEEPDEPTTSAPVPTDDWSLVRTASGQSGWVLSRRLIMAIPDEVAQYAEGHRIVSYFSLGKTADGDQMKDTWLWTTISGSGHPYDFDSYRVFIWSLKRHRYETAAIDRNLRGYAPVLLKDVIYTGAARSPSDASTKFPGFSICVMKNDGQRYRREYALLGNIVRFAGEYPCEPAQPIESLLPPTGTGTTQVATAEQSDTAPAPESFTQKVKKKLSGLFKK